MKLPITVLILTYNEEANIGRALERLKWAERVVVIDSFSTDGTLSILTRYPQVEVIRRKFDSHAGQCNFGLGQVRTEWVLSLDADYVVAEALIEEIAGLSATGDGPDAYFAGFKYCISGEPLRASLLPPRAVLFRKAGAVYESDGHAHRLKFEGPSGFLKGVIYHDDRKSFQRWLRDQERYAELECAKLREASWRSLGWADKVRKMRVLAPCLIGLYCLIGKGLVLDGWRGLCYAFQRVLAETILSLKLIAADLKR